MRLRTILLLVLLGIFCWALPGEAVEKPRAFVGTITDTECGASHARMLARGGMGKTSASCTRACVARGATYGILVGKHRRFYQLDDQEKPAPFAGRRVVIRGRRDGDTILLESIEPAR